MCLAGCLYRHIGNTFYREHLLVYLVHVTCRVSQSLWRPPFLTWPSLCAQTDTERRRGEISEIELSQSQSYWQDEDLHQRTTVRGKYYKKKNLTCKTRTCAWGLP
jgi:hypothetical protein